MSPGFFYCIKAGSYLQVIHVHLQLMITKHIAMFE